MRRPFSFLIAGHLLLALGALVGCAAQGVVGQSRVDLPALPSAVSASCGLPQFRETVVQYVNAARSSARSCGGQRVPAAAPLVWNADLFTAAARHSFDMARRNYFAHASPEGARVAQRASAAGYDWHAIGENLAGGDTSIDAVVAGWLGSESHCRNLMNPAYVEVAASCVHQPGTAWGTYWTLLLGRR